MIVWDGVLTHVTWTQQLRQNSSATHHRGHHNRDGHKTKFRNLELDYIMASWHVHLDEVRQCLTNFSSPFLRHCSLCIPLGIRTAQEVFQKRTAHHLMKPWRCGDQHQWHYYVGKLRKPRQAYQGNTGQVHGIGLTLNTKKREFHCLVHRSYAVNRRYPARPQQDWRYQQHAIFCLW